MEDYVTYDQAVRLKELVFDWECYTFYHWDNWCGLSHSGLCENHNMFEKCISAPTLAQVQKWLREKHYLSTEVFSSLDGDNQWEWHYYIQDLNDHLERPADSTIHCDGYQSYEQALLAGIYKALELIKTL